MLTPFERIIRDEVPLRQARPPFDNWVHDQMAKKKASRLSKRREAEAAEALEQEEGTKKKKKATKKKAVPRKAKKKVAARKQLIWVIFNGNMKEEARFPYDLRKDAEAKIKQLKAKATKKSYFIQPMKVELTEKAEAK